MRTVESRITEPEGCIERYAVQDVTELWTSIEGALGPKESHGTQGSFGLLLLFSPIFVALSRRESMLACAVLALVPLLPQRS